MQKKLIRHTLFWAIVLGLLFVGRAFAIPCLRVNPYITLPNGTVEGHLDNGLRYIILPNELPRHNIEVRMVECGLSARGKRPARWGTFP